MNYGMWESSRMILPEHREAIIHQRQESKRKTRPELDEQAWEEYNRLIRERWGLVG